MEGAADEFLKYTKAGGKVLKGLVTRRNDERALFLS
jgi:lysozyme